jgi:hypothetical protein
MLGVRCSALLAALALAVATASAEPWTIVDGSLEHVTASSLSIARGAVHGDATDARSPAFDAPVSNFVSAARGTVTAVQAGRLVVHLADGARLVGVPVSSTDESLTFHTPTLGDQSILLSAIIRIDRTLESPSAADAEPLEEDVITLANRDTLRGVVTAIDAENLTISVGEQPTTIALANLATVRFAAVAPPGNAAATRRPAFALTLADGSIIHGDDLKTTDDGTWSITLTGTTEGSPAAPESLKTDQIVRIEHLAGPVAWLSSLAPVSMAYTPYLGESFPPAMDAPAGGGSGPIHAGDRAYEHGIGVHARTTITYALDGSHRAFRTRYAAEPGLSLTDATVTIRLDDRVAHTGRVTGGFVSDVIFIDLGDAKTLTLDVDFGGGLHTQDRVNWLEPALVNDLPPEPGNTTTRPATTQP